MPAAVITDENLVSKLCLDCGLCCSGALFDNGILEDDEIDFARDQGFQIIEVELKGEPRHGFAQTCPMLCGTSCSIYDQQRPSVCSAYFCELAKNLDRGEVDLATAQGHVSNAHTLFEQLRPLLHENENYAQARKRWIANETPNSVTPDKARFDLLMMATKMLYDRHFRKR